MYLNKQIGKYGEDIATKYLKNLNYEIIDRNFRCKNGEIDIIAKDEDLYVFIEVKTRTTSLYGYPIEAVNKVKQGHIIKAINYYLYKNKIYNTNIRLDVIEIYLNSGGSAKVNHVKQIL